jgi:PadR family transcriptional regulator PadR
MAFKGDLEALVLGVLQDGELHGYEISKRIKLISAKALQVGEGQLYPALHKLEKEVA